MPPRTARSRSNSRTRRLPPGYAVTGASPEEARRLADIDAAASYMFAHTDLLHYSHIGAHIPLHTLEAEIRLGNVFTVRDPRGEAQGFALVSKRPGTFYLDQISVHPDSGRRGLGGALLDRVAIEARLRGERRVTLSTFRSLSWNGPWYRRHGYREVPLHRKADWMLRIESVQRESMWIERRCFMCRELEPLGVLRARLGGGLGAAGARLRKRADGPKADGETEAG